MSLFYQKFNLSSPNNIKMHMREQPQINNVRTYHYMHHYDTSWLAHIYAHDVIGGLRRFDAPRELSFLLRRATILMGWHRQSNGQRCHYA